MMTPQIDLSLFTPEEQQLIADCFTRIKDLADPQQQEAVIREMLPAELIEKVMAAMEQAQQPQQPQGLSQTFQV